MEYSALTKEEKKNIFETVNSIHLHLKGDQKKALKNSFCNVWKINKTVGAFELMVKLYESEDVYDKMNETFLRYIKDGYSNEYYINHKSLPYAKHVRRMANREQEVDDLQNELDDLKEEKGFISQQDHEDKIKELKKEHKEIIRQKEDEINKLINFETGLRAKLDAANERYEKQAVFYEAQIDQMCNTES